MSEVEAPTTEEEVEPVEDAADDEEVEPEDLPDEEPEHDPSPVDEVIPIIRVGDWARIKGTASKVPAHARGRDVSVVRANIRRTGPDTLSTVGYEYQLENDVFRVRLRDTNEEFECGRSSFAAFGPDRGALNGLTK